jgi:putative tricarboxylic transport membrane protein
MSDRIFGAVCLVLGLAFIYGATQIQTGFIVDPLGPRMFPIIIGGIMVLGAIVPLLKPDPAPDWPAKRAIGEIVLVLAVLVAYALTLTLVGFVPATTVAAAIISWRLGARPMWAAVTGIGVAVGIYVVFHLILGLSLARGPLGF